uniref:3'(2'),5'-bisphosphate nucleotidase n=1 Tax=Rhodosorus marinus TaxID=101924 RepID=A0A6T6LS05_9RHOD
MSLLKELSTGLSVVRKACLMAVRVRKMASEGSLWKADKSAVTIADLAIQAIALHELSSLFSEDSFIAEESSLTVRGKPELSARVREVLAKEGCELSESQILEILDKGGALSTSGRVWTLDPVDGTRGFIDGGQYAVALAFLVDGFVEIGIIGCPALPDTLTGSSGRVGSIFYAVRGRGAIEIGLGDDSRHDLRADGDAPIRVVEAAESNVTSYAHSAFVASTLGWGSDPPVRRDSCCKYAMIARGQACSFIKQPKVSYVEKVWDHAAGVLILTDAGGKVTDGSGIPFDFSSGRELNLNNRGIIAAASASLHCEILQAIDEARGALGLHRTRKSKVTPVALCTGFPIQSATGPYCLSGRA